MEGYHIRFDEVQRIATIHKPTDNWEHNPRSETSDYGFWIGPLSNEKDTEIAARGVAKFLGYSVRFCKPCFPDRFPPPPTRGDHVRGPAERRKHRRERGGTLR